MHKVKVFIFPYTYLESGKKSGSYYAYTKWEEVVKKDFYKKIFLIIRKMEHHAVVTLQFHFITFLLK